MAETALTYYIKPTRLISILIFSLALTAIVFSCSKDATSSNPVIPPNFKLNYGDSVFYLQNQAGDYVVSPVQTLAGAYTGFPEGIDINEQTGAINVSKSETGLRYRISFTPTGSTDTFSTVILISGINFLDGFYKLTTADSILHPIYNATAANSVPGTGQGSIFDEGSSCNAAGCNVNVINGSINLAQTVRNGVFGTTPANNDRHEFDMNYRISDKSNKALNTLKVKLYFFNSINDVTQEAYDIIASRAGTVLRSANTTRIAGSNAVNKAAKPRPPCIFILAK